MMSQYNTKLTAKRIKECGLAKSLSQEDLGNLLGKERTNIANYESGRVTLPSNVVVDLSNIFNVSSDYLLGLSDNPFSEHSEHESRKLNRFLNSVDEKKRKRAMLILELAFKEDFDAMQEED